MVYDVDGDGLAGGDGVFIGMIRGVGRRVGSMEGYKGLWCYYGIRGPSVWWVSTVRGGGGGLGYGRCARELMCCVWHRALVLFAMSMEVEFGGGMGCV